MKLGAITNGISEDLDESLQVMVDKGLVYAELASVWGVNIGHHTDAQNDIIADILGRYGCTASSVSPRSFYELRILDTTVESAGYLDDFATLRRSIDLAKKLGTRSVRAMPFQRPSVIFGSNGAGVPMFATALASQLFQAGMTSYPGEDNWAIVKVLEGMAGTIVKSDKCL